MSSNPNGTVDYPFCTAPDNGGALAVAPGVLWIRLTLPFQLDHINVWALDGGDAGWTLVDAGLGNRRTRETWEGLLATALAGKPVERVVVTHFHPDHIGAADWLVQRTGADFATSLTEWLVARMLCGGNTPATDAAMSTATDTAAERFYRRSGLDAETQAAVRNRAASYALGVPGVPATLTRLRAGDVLTVGRTPWRVIGGAGHTAEPVSLYDAANGVLIPGDQILPRISPNISVWPSEPDADPLADYLASLEAWSELPADTLVLPSHGLPFRGLHGRAAELADHHAARLEEIVPFCAAPQTAVAVMRHLFNRPLDTHQTVFAIGEAIAHLNHLIRRGALRRETGPDGIDLYRQAAGKGGVTTR